MSINTTEKQSIVLSAQLDVEELEGRVLLSALRDGEGWEAGSDDPSTLVREGCSGNFLIKFCYRW